jgi:hypothetical protein
LFFSENKVSKFFKNGQPKNVQKLKPPIIFEKYQNEKTSLLHNALNAEKIKNAWLHSIFRQK